MTSTWIGLMSGTSLDGVDGVLVQLGPEGQWQGQGQCQGQGVLAHAFCELPSALRKELLALNTAGDNELHRAAIAGQALSACYANVVASLCAQVPNARPSAIGAHGQTVRHRPELGYTLQLLNPAVLAELTGLDVVADFRSRDVAAGGQGAPLVPVFHQAVFAQAAHAVAVLNIGGMANVSLLPTASSAATAPLGFDCGPGNVLMDLWIQANQGHAFDANGQWAQQGTVQAAWLAEGLADPYFHMPPPKSTGRDHFHANWLISWLQTCGVAHHALRALSPAQAADVQATLCELTAASVAQAILQAQAQAPQAVLVCGGGAMNSHLMARLAAQLQRCYGQTVPVESTALHGLPPMQVEAAAFAWLAWACMQRRAGNMPSVTGARGPRVLGAVYPA
jgi:anhydro-N-acetylmuramic acid kinase